MYMSLMGTFDLHAPIKYLGTTSVGKKICTFVDRNDPWVLPSQEEPSVPFATTEVAYQAIFDATVDFISTPYILEESDEYYFPAWEENSTYLYDYLDMVLQYGEAISKAMIGEEKHCEDLHHKCYFVLDVSKIENSEFNVRLIEGID